MTETGGLVRSRWEDTPRRAAFWQVTGTLVAKVVGFLGDIVVARLFGRTTSLMLPCWPRTL